MKTFEALIEERYVWRCPYCGEMCNDDYDDPADREFVECEHCEKEAKCIYTER